MPWLVSREPRYRFSSRLGKKEKWEKGRRFGRGQGGSFALGNGLAFSFSYSFSFSVALTKKRRRRRSVRRRRPNRSLMRLDD
jgi:hypothetical protein